MAILNPWVSSLKVWIVFYFGNDFLFKSILAGCEIFEKGLNWNFISSQVEAENMKEKLSKAAENVSQEAIALPNQVMEQVNLAPPCNKNAANLRDIYKITGMSTTFIRFVIQFLIDCRNPFWYK